MAADIKPNAIVIEFVDDHRIDGASIVVHDVTPQQIAVAIHYLQRAANRLADLVEASQAVKSREQTLEVARSLPSKMIERN